MDDGDVVERHLRQYGFRPAGDDLDQVRAVLTREAGRERDAAWTAHYARYVRMDPGDSSI